MKQLSQIITILTITLFFTGCSIIQKGNTSGDSFEVGVWLNRHTMQEGEQAIVDFLDLAEEKGVTDIYPNFWFHGYVIYPGSDYVDQHPDFEGEDPLSIVIREAHARGMDVHPWAEYGFFTHYNRTDSQDDVGYILKDHPEWITKNKEGKVSLYNEGQGFSHYSINPAHPEAREFLVNIFMEVVEEYPNVDGLHVDRIRYKGEDWSYDEFSRNAFEEEHGVDPMDIEEDDEEMMARWVDWREQQTTQFMAELSENFRDEFPGKIISGAVVPPYMQNEKFQRWDTWAKEGYIDVVIPMLYGGFNLVTEEHEKTLQMLPDGFPVQAGLAASMDNEDYTTAVEYVKRRNAEGIVIWSSANLDEVPSPEK